MADRLPVQFRKSGDAIASYDFVEFSSGRGYIKFLGGVTRGSQMSGATGVLSGSVFLSNVAIASEPSYQRVRHSINAAAKIFHVEFDAEFLKPVIVDGLAYVTQPVLMRNAGALQTLSSYMNATIKKVSDGVITTLGTKSGAILSLAVANATNVEHTFNNEIDLPRTKFKIGDKLRVATELYNWSDLGNAHIVLFAHDPMNRTYDDSLGGDSTETWTKESTNMVAMIPFITDI